MGVPSFFKWLVNKYPKVVADAKEERAGGGEAVNLCSPNPNGMEFDNLYLDMNGIIHPCFHPNDDTSPSPTTFGEVFEKIFAYIDRLFSVVRPRKVLYLAIDGVAPRAKMNQQRSRRFRAAMDIQIREEEEERLRNEFERQGKHVLPSGKSELDDSNIISPGTEFMYKLSLALENYILERMSNDASWKNIKVVLSDANVPGEGEHKIMDFIRVQRAHPEYNPNTRHCLYGSDADLIMLALATHEIHFSILRENITTNEEGTTLTASNTRKTEHVLSRSRWRIPDDITKNVDAAVVTKSHQWQFLHVWTLREYLEIDLTIADPPQNVVIDIERLVDDFVFFCFFSGNDFLPQMPTLEIREGAIDLLMTIYKREFKNLGGYLVDMNKANDKKNAFIKLKRVEKFIISVGAYEEEIFKKRSESKQRGIKKFLLDHSEDLQNEDGVFDASGNTLNEITMSAVPSVSDVSQNTMDMKKKLKDCLRNKSDLFKQGNYGRDKVRLEAAGFKDRYYKEKFHAETPDAMEKLRKQVVQKYTEGLVWVLSYYYSGVPSWTWFFPFHYGPFASDLKGISQVAVKFQKGSPFKPFDQLMAVLPPRSASALPKAHQLLMTSEESKIIDFYPSDFKIDTEGKRFTWQGIFIFPFIEEERLLAETRKLEKNLGADELDRNGVNDDKLFMKKTGIQIIAPDWTNDSEDYKIQLQKLRTIDGFKFPPDTKIGKIHQTGPGDSKDMICICYKLPENVLLVPRTLAGVEYPEKSISEADVMDTKLWHEYQGYRSNERFQGRSDATYERKFNSRNKNSFPEMTFKGSGPSWYGRGRVPCPQGRSRVQGDFEVAMRIPGMSDRTNVHGNRWSSSSAGENKWNSGPAYTTGRLHIKSAEATTKDVNDNIYKGVKDLKLSDHAQEFRAGRGRGRGATREEDITSSKQT